MMNPLSTFRVARAALRLVRDPTRLEEVFTIADAMENAENVAKIEADIRKDPALRRAVDSRVRIGRIDVARLGTLPRGTLGREFADFLVANGLNPEDIEVPNVRSDFDYVRAHLRETHDVWHVATGFRTDVAGELGLQAFYAAQFVAPLAVMLLSVGMVNTLFFAMDDSDARMRAISRGWLLGKRAKLLFGYRWAERWDWPLVDVQRELGLAPRAVDAAIENLVGPESAEPGAATTSA